MRSPIQSVPAEAVPAQKSWDAAVLPKASAQMGNTLLKKPGGTQMEGHVNVRVLRSLEELESIRDIWMGWQTHPNSDIDFYIAVLKSLPNIERPHVMVLYRNDRPEALLAARLENSRMEFGIGYRTLLRPRVRMLTFIHAGLLGNSSPENVKAFTDSIALALRSREAEVGFFNQVPVDSILYNAITTSPGIRNHYPASKTHRGMKLADSVDSFYKSLSSKVRKNQKWQAKKLLQDFNGKVRIDCLQRPDELERLFRDVEEVAKKTYQRGLGAGFIDNPQTRHLMDLQSRKGWLRTYVLYLEDKPCAFWIAVVYARVFHSIAMGYDPAYSKHSPGMFLIMKTVEGLCSRQGGEDAGEIDFGFGDAQYKEILGSFEWKESPLYLFAPTAKGRLLGIMRGGTELLDRIAQRILDRTQLLARVKRVWRGRLSGKQR
jgi:hypothetical protein